MRILIVLLFITMLAFSGCATQKACCPPKDVVIVVPIGEGLLPIGINKGILDEQYEDDFWVDAEKYDKMMEEDKIKDELKKESEDAAKETDKTLGI